MSARRAPIPFGRYVLRERLAKGGMGEVFRAAAIGERGFEKPVVIKRVLPEHAARSALSDLFVEEARLMTRLSHPNVVEVLDFGSGEGGEYFLVLEYVEGLDVGRLAAWMRARGEAFPIPLALSIATQALRGLHHAHTRAESEGVVLVHRDVSPSNVLLSVEGEVKVADFGVALRRRVGEKRAASGVVGKPAYMAPEQYEGNEIDARADVFAVGVVLFELLTGALPFEGESEAERQDAARRGDFGRARDVRAEVTPELDAALRRALAPSPEARFRDAKAMARSLAECGLPLAESDDIAEVVRAAVASQGAPRRRVVALSADRGGGDEDEGDGGTRRELTRTGGPDGAAAFTLRVMDERAPFAGDARAAEVGATPYDRAVAPRRDGSSSREAATRIESARRGEALTGSEAGTTSGGAMRSELSSTPSGEGPALSQGYTPAPTDGDAAVTSSRALRRRGVGVVLGLVGAVAALGALGFLMIQRVGSPSASQSAAARVSAAPSSSTSAASLEVTSASSTAPSASANSTKVDENSTEIGPQASSRATSPLAPLEPSTRLALTASRVRPPQMSAAASAAPTAAPAASAASAAPPVTTAVKAGDCTGMVKFASSGSYAVSGGPGAAQTPGIYSWPCGSYGLTAVSRSDPSKKKSASVVVRAGATSVVDLREQIAPQQRR